MNKTKRIATEVVKQIKRRGGNTQPAAVDAFAAELAKYIPLNMRDVPAMADVCLGRRRERVRRGRAITIDTTRHSEIPKW